MGFVSSQRGGRFGVVSIEAGRQGENLSGGDYNNYFVRGMRNGVRSTWNKTPVEGEEMGQNIDFQGKRSTRGGQKVNPRAGRPRGQKSEEKAMG